MSKNYDTECIIARYQEEPVSIGKIAEDFNLCSTTVSRVLKRNNVPLWTRQDLNLGSLIVDYFKTIDDENKAYLLGLFAADGCIYQNKLFSIQLQSNDGYMVEYIKTVLNAPRKIVIDRRDQSFALSIINDTFVDHLIKHGVVEGKSNRFLPDISDQLMPHYVRGLFDGDGSIVIRKAHSYGKAINCCVVLLAHLNLINQLREYLDPLLNLSKLSLCSDGGTAYSLRYKKRSDFIALTSYIYSNAHVYLKRKFQKYQQALSYLC